MKLTFLGATHEVTGSHTLLEWMDGRYLLVDYGMVQGDDNYVNEPIPVPVSRIEYVLLTHAHIDHSGNLPLLYKQGFRGKIYCTAETMNLCQIMLADSAHIQASEAMTQSKKNQRKGLPAVEPIYTAEDVAETMKLFQPWAYQVLYRVDEGLTIRFTDVGHLLGSAAIECFLEEEGVHRTLVFSGDVGNINQPILNNPKPVPAADYLMIESTYGNRLHPAQEDAMPILLDVLEKTFQRGGSVIIPSFAVGRTQELLYFFREIKQKNLLPAFPDFPVYVDSPLANEATAIFLQCDVACLDDQTREIMRQGQNPIWFDGLHTVTEVEESKRLNENTDCKVVIASGGMCDGGRIRHHLKHTIWDGKNTILFAGYQANGTLGRIICDGAKSVKIYGEEIEVKAQISILYGVSGHADQKGLMDWIGQMQEKPKLVFVNHGDDENCEALVRLLEETFRLTAAAPWSGSSFDLLSGEWIRLTDAVPQPGKKSTPTEKKKPSESALLYRNLVQTAQQLLETVRGMEGHANSELREWTEKINAILRE